MTSATLLYQHIEHWVLIGTNFTKADSQTRGRFAISKEFEAEVHQQASQMGLTDFFFISTCNRTEFYACGSMTSLKQIVREQLSLSDNDLQQFFYAFSGIRAIRHFTRVVAGLDSQIVGDYEIVGQVKAALDAARGHQLVGTITDRISNFAFQAQKKIKSETSLSNGKYSVSHAAIELISHKRRTAVFQNILLVGAGDFGTTVARNLRQNLRSLKLTITNRTNEKAIQLADEVKAEVIAFDDFQQHLDKFDVVITTVGLGHYLIKAGDIPARSEKIFLDLSVPPAVDPVVKAIPGVRLFTVDEVSQFHNALLVQRQLEIPHAERIIEDYLNKLLEWQHIHSHRHVVMAYKNKIMRLLDDGERPISMKSIERSFSSLMGEIREEGYAGCRVIEVVNSLVATTR